jgi:hypothetical protein
MGSTDEWRFDDPLDYPMGSAPGSGPPSNFDYVLDKVCYVVLWPLFVTLVKFRDTPNILIPLLWLVTGMFWGFVIELLFIAKFQKRDKTPVRN